MNHLLLDSNGYTAFKKGHQEVIQILKHAEMIALSVITIGELVSGFSIGNQCEKNLNELKKFLEVPRVIIYPIDETTPAFYATVHASLRKKGKPIPTNDIWIAATALQRGCKLCSFDKHFSDIENLIVVTKFSEFFF